MALASFQLIINSIQKIIEFTSREGSIPTVELSVILISVGTVGKVAFLYKIKAGPHSVVSNVSDCRSRGRKFDPGLVPYVRVH